MPASERVSTLARAARGARKTPPLPALPRRADWLAFAVFLVGAPARAHQPGISKLDLRIGAQRTTAELVFARSELAALVPGADADRSGTLDELELLAIEAPLGEVVRAGVALAADGADCPVALERLAFVEEDGLAASLAFACPAAPASVVTVRLGLLARLAAAHRVVARAVFIDMSQGPGSDAAPLDFVLHGRRPALTVRRPDVATKPDVAATPDEPARAPTPAHGVRWPWLAVVPLALAAWVFRRRRARP